MANNINAFSMQLRCFYLVISLTFQPKSNAIARKKNVGDWKKDTKHH